MNDGRRTIEKDTSTGGRPGNACRYYPEIQEDDHQPGIALTGGNSFEELADVQSAKKCG
jgi:hypothetical protein